MSGYFGIGIENGKTAANIGTLWRSAFNLGASFIFTVGKRYDHQASDTLKAFKSIPLYHYSSFAEFYASLPHACMLVGAEYPNESSQTLENFKHPNQAIYLLGAEDHGLSKIALSRCHRLIYIPSIFSLNVSVSGSIIMYDRQKKNRDTRRTWPT